MRSKYLKIDYPCDYCGKTFSRSKNKIERSKHRFCSLDCRYLFDREDPFTYFLCRIKSRSRRHGIDCTIGISDLYDIWTGRCSLTGEKILIYDSFRKNHILSNGSIDRINSNEGYHSSNIQWVIKNVNIMKSNLSQRDFIKICNQVSNYKGDAL